MCPLTPEFNNELSLVNMMAQHLRAGVIHPLANRLSIVHEDEEPANPQNTPATPSVSATRSTATTAPSVGEQIVNPVTERLETLQCEEPGRFWEQDTMAPNNTPVSTTHLRPRIHGLLSIEEVIQNLPEACSGPYSRHSPRSVDGTSEISENRSLRSSLLDGEDARSTSPLTIRAPPPTAVTGISTLETVGIPNEGVFEFTDWEQEAEELMQTALARLAQLAVDKARKDSSKTAEEYYRSKLNKILNKPTMPFPFGDIETSSMPLPSTVVEATVSPVHTPTIAETRICELEVKVDKLMKFMEDTLKASKDQGAREKIPELEKVD